ncbi:MAG TPA: FtsW/RodA/SpoVE family cell cycle protein, partial [Egibacteraceae bacterium]
MSQTTYGDDRAERLAREAVRRHWMGSYAPNRHVDFGLVVGALLLSAFGLVMVYSATFHELEAAGADPATYLNRQTLALGVGIAAAAAVTVVDYRVYRAWAPVLYGLSILLLIATLVMGTVVNASRSWIVIGSFQFQPAEFAKPALIVTLAALFHERREEALGLRALVEALALAAVPMVLI